MKLHAPFVQLPIRFDAQRLADEVLALGESKWRPHPQGFAGNSMLPLVAVGGDPANENFAGRMRPTPELLASPYLLQTLAAFGATVGRTRLMRLSGGAEVTRHADQFYYWTERVRIHVPIVTQPSVRFECGQATLNMAAGECWIFDTWRQHRVLNDDARARIHLVCDSVGGEGFWAMVEAGRAVDTVQATRPEWQARPVPYEPAAQPVMAWESYNLPGVLSPWELKRHLEFLLDELPPSPQQAAMRPHVRKLCQGWRGLWASHGDAVEARPEYRRLLDQCLGDMQPLAAHLVLRNDLSFFPALMAGVGRVAVQAASPSAGREATLAPADQPYRH